MSFPTPPNPAKLTIGIFTQDKGLAESVAETLENRYGPIDIVSKWFVFDRTDYYEKEMGARLVRRIFSFQTPISQDSLSDIKHVTNSIEQRYTANGCRRVNLDPGYLLLERFVLATGKNFAHRIYIGRNIYADLTLIYHDKAFRPLPWTYPDYTDPDIITFLHRVRDKYVYDKKIMGA